MPDKIATTVERFRPKANPERYRANAEQHKAELVQQGERILLQYELAVGDPNLSDTDRKTVLGNIENSMASVLWRVNELDEILAAYELGHVAGMNRAERRRLLKREVKSTMEEGP